MRHALIIFSKNVVPGKVKTRLAATIGHDAALKVYQQLLHHTKIITQKINADKFVYYSDEIVHDDLWNHGFIREQQKGLDLGERMMKAFEEVFHQGYSKVIIIGTDCPSLNEIMIEEAFDKLKGTDVVIGPAYDGGYYLLGMKKLYSCLFKNIQWSTSSVFRETIQIFNGENINYSLLQKLHDVDEEKDLIHMKTLA